MVPAVAVKLAELAPAAALIEAGTVNAVTLLEPKPLLGLAALSASTSTSLENAVDHDPISSGNFSPPSAKRWGGVGGGGSLHSLSCS